MKLLIICENTYSSLLVPAFEWLPVTPKVVSKAAFELEINCSAAGHEYTLEKID
jgi:hypothetical protein